MTTMTQTPADRLDRLDHIEGLDLTEATDLQLTNLWVELYNIGALHRDRATREFAAILTVRVEREQAGRD